MVALIFYGVGVVVTWTVDVGRGVIDGKLVWVGSGVIVPVTVGGGGVADFSAVR